MLAKSLGPSTVLILNLRYFALTGSPSSKRTSEATSDYSRLMQVWSQADADLPQLRLARAWMESRVVSGE